MLNKLITDAIHKVPDIIPLLSYKARIIFGLLPDIKSAEMYQNRIEKQVRELYDDKKDDTFVEEFMLLIAAYLLLAYRQAWQDEGGGQILPDYLQQMYQAQVLAQLAFVQQYHDDIVAARETGGSIDDLIARSNLWAVRWNEAYNSAVLQIATENGGKLIWQYGDTDHCDTCRQLDGIVAFASEWQAVGVKPQSAPNDMLDCEGWRCQCTLTITTAKRTPNAIDKIQRAVSG